jgi:hypothetical protein
MAHTQKLVDRFGGLGDALEEAKKRMGLGADTKVTLFELPKKSGSLFGVLGNLLGVQATDPSGQVIMLPLIQSIVKSIPGSVLVSPEGAQTRLPYDIIWN